MASPAQSGLSCRRGGYALWRDICRRAGFHVALCLPCGAAGVRAFLPAGTRISKLIGSFARFGI